MVDTYGAPLHRVPIDLGFGCPNRGPDGRGGCAFCAEDGARSRVTGGATSVEAQIFAAVQFARRRYRAEHFMAYVQAFTGTFAPVSEQEAAYEGILKAFPFDSLTIGTRPDCLSGPTLDLLSALRSRIDLWVEVGVQTIHDDTLARINRGHTWAASRLAIEALDRRGIRVAVHVILGLPGESADHFRRTAEALAALPIQGIKIHNLHVLRNTALADAYRRNPFPVWDEAAYAAVLIDFLRRLPPQMAIIRINTDTPEADRIAPGWTLTKGQFLEHVKTEMQGHGWRQGDLRV
jgi:radical SAM protein (TIGR01212 family)